MKKETNHQYIINKSCTVSISKHKQNILQKNLRCTSRIPSLFFFFYSLNKIRFCFYKLECDILLKCFASVLKRTLNRHTLKILDEILRIFICRSSARLSVCLASVNQPTIIWVAKKSMARG